MDKGGEKKQQPWPFIWIAIAIFFIILFFFFSSSYLSPTSAEQVSYSEFKKMIDEKKFEEVMIEQNHVKGIIKEKDKKIEVKAVKVEDPDLIKLLEKNNIKFSGKETDTWLRDFILAWVIPIVIFILIWRFLFGRLGTGAGITAVGRSKASLYVEKDTGVTFNDVAGVDEAKEELKEVIDFLQHPDKYIRLGGKIPKGVLLVGPTGTGKTLLAKAVAGEAKVPFFSISGSEFVEMFVGVGAARVRDLFAQAEQKAPCIIFIDEIDALGKARIAAPVGGGYEEREHTLQQLLVEMDGFDTKKGIIIMAATNRPEILDPALLRPGRFDRHILVDRPDIKGREEILKVHAKNVKLSKELDLKIIAARTPGFAGADLANVVNEAAILAARKDKNAVELSDFEEAINRAIAGLEKKKKVISKKEQEIIAYHESGHAIVAESVPHADKVHRVSIIPRGIAALGYTLQLPTEDRYLLTKTELLDRLAVLMGGRVAEEIIFNESSTGAQNDLERATAIARSMVVEYGMSERLGPVTFESGKKPLFLDIGYTPTSEFSEETSRLIDEEVSRIIKETYSRVRGILEEKKGKLLILGKMLIEKEVIEGDELRKILSSNI
ncbi:MAG: ATP-dependent metallopeptidase FtsH/Yme1/Tma family protein [Nitrospirae bacterium]|nr:ATP-dependent metallopeptidase FtsH/Yme1/Tma family protein [Nitrospirota bacterium]